MSILDSISASDVVNVCLTLLSAFGVLVWALFRNICKQVERVIEKVDVNGESIGALQQNVERQQHETELRIINRIDRMDANMDAMTKDIGELYSRVSVVETKVKLLHGGGEHEHGRGAMQ